jgi:hypothetical protein
MRENCMFHVLLTSRELNGRKALPPAIGHDRGGGGASGGGGGQHLPHPTAAPQVTATTQAEHKTQHVVY